MRSLRINVLLISEGMALRWFKDFSLQEHFLSFVDDS